MKRWTRVVALVIAGLFLFSVVWVLVATVAGAASAPQRSETVYVDLDETGKPLSILSNVYITNPGELDVVTDDNNLTDMKNILGSEQPEIQGSVSSWKAEGEDVCFQGKGTAQLPITASISYYLDGKPIAPAELAGKSGRVRLEFAFENKLPRTALVEGESIDMYVPFTVVTMLTLSEAFTSVTAQNAKVSVEAGVPVVMGIQFPGLAQSLGVEAKDQLSESFWVEADVENFELQSAMIVAVNGLIIESDLSGIEDVEELTSGIESMESAASQLAYGAKKLQEGTGELRDGIEEYVNAGEEIEKGIQQAAEGSDEITGGIAAVGGGIGSIAAGAKDMQTQVDQAVSEAKEQLDQMKDKTEAEIAASISSTLQEQGIPKEQADAAGAAIAAAVVANLSYDQVVGALDSLSAGLGQLSSGAAALSDGVDELCRGSMKLTDGLEELAGGMGEYREGGLELYDGADQVYGGIGELYQGLRRLNREGLTKLVDATADVNVSLSRKDALLELSNQYRTYSGTGQGDNNVKFVMNTPEIYVPKPLETPDEDQQTAAEPQAEPGFFERIWNWIKGLFS